MPLISIVTACYNEVDNIELLHEKIREEFLKLNLNNLKNYKFEHIFIDNNSQDGTQEKLKYLAEKYSNIKIIFNARNFGHIRSPYHALLEARGDAVIVLVADLQDPPEKIPEFIKQWERGFKIVIGVKPSAEENGFMFSLRKFYYGFSSKISEIKLIKNFTGFGLYDQCVLKELRLYKEPYPYFRGLIAELGFEICEIPYHQPLRKYGKTKNNFYTNFDLALLGITSHSKLPLRLATIAGFSLGLISFVLALVYLILKLFFWSSFSLGMAPLMIGLFFFSGVQLFFLGLLGEYILNIYIRIQDRPHVVERERIGW